MNVIAETQKSARTRGIYIGLGSNIENPDMQIKNAIEALNELPESKVLMNSGYYRSKPMGPKDQPDYVNAVVEIETTWSAGELLKKCQLIEQRQGIAHRSSRLTGHYRDRLFICRQTFCVENRADSLANQSVRDQSKVVLLAPRANRHGNLVAFGSRENELHMVRRLFECLEEGVECARRQHVNLVDDDDFVTVPLWPVR